MNLDVDLGVVGVRETYFFSYEFSLLNIFNLSNFAAFSFKSVFSI